MAKRSVKIPSPTTGKMVDGIEMDIDESTERWSEFTLPDGAVLRIKVSLISATRIDGEYDQDGNPTYVIRASPTMVVASAPDKLKKKKTQ
jgi:hypothetical protein